MEFFYLPWLEQIVVIFMIVQTALSAGGRTGAIATNGGFSPTTWYIRSDGGTRFSVNVSAGQCNGKFNASYASTGGSGTNQNCAFNDFRYLWDDDSGACPLGCAGQWVIAGGDTVYVRDCLPGSNQMNPSGTTCRIGWDQNGGGGPTNLWCQFQGNNICFNPTIPAGTSAHPTKILGFCVLSSNCHNGNVTDKGNLAQLFGGMGLVWTFNLKSTQWIDIEGIYLSTHNRVNSGGFTGQNCVVAGSPAYPTNCATSPPLDDFADNGFLFDNTSANITMSDVIVDGMAASGFWGPIGGPITLTRVQSNFNGADGWNFDDGSDTPDASGSQLILSYLTMNGNGCNEEYPLVHVFPARSCYDSTTNSAGGDTLSGQDTILDTLTCDHCVFMYNTKDSFIGPHTQVLHFRITDSFAYGNMGAQWKWGRATGSDLLFQNNLTVTNCLRMSELIPGAAQNFNQSTALNGSYLVNFCRAGGAGFANVARTGDTSSYIGNTIIAAGNIVFQEACGVYSPGNVFTFEFNCNTSSNIVKNNNFFGYTDPNPILGTASALYCALSSDSSCNLVSDGGISFTGTFNDELGLKPGTVDTCGSSGNICSDPTLNGQPATTWPGSEAALDVYDALNIIINAFMPLPASILKGAGVTTTGFSLDYYGATRPSPPSMGGVEVPSGTTWFVTTGGSDSNPCTLASPCLTPAHAFNTVATPGDTVYVAPGVYDNGGSEIHFNTAGTAGHPITLTCGGTPGSCTLRNNITGNNTVVQMTSDYQVINGFEVTNTGAGNNIGIYILGAHVAATRNIVHQIEAACDSNGGGGIGGSGNDMTMDSNLVYDIGWTNPACQAPGAVQVHALNFETNIASTWATITNNIVYHSAGGWGIQIQTGGATSSNKTIVANNLVFSSGNGGIVMSEVGGALDYSVVINNIFLVNGVYNSQCGIDEIGVTGTHNVYQNNDAFGNAGGNYCFTTGSQTGGISIDPSSNTTFINWQSNGTGDYHERFGSPTLSVGVTTNAPNHDFDGYARPGSYGWDIGAYQK